MESIKLWAISLCGALVITSIFRFLVSNSTIYKSVNIFLSIFIFLYSVIPIGNMFSYKSLDFDVNEETQSYEEYYKNTYEQIVLKVIENVCSENDVKLLSADFDSYIDENDYYCVRKIDIKIQPNTMNKKIKSVLYSQFGFEVNVY